MNLEAIKTIDELYQETSRQRWNHLRKRNIATLVIILITGLIGSILPQIPSTLTMTINILIILFFMFMPIFNQQSQDNRHERKIKDCYKLLASTNN